MRIKLPISVVIPTRNNAPLLKRSLNSLLNQKFSPLEIIVVDNFSKDSTKEVVFSFMKKLPLKYLIEKRIGASASRNKAIKILNGKIVAFLDSDCVVEKEWIVRIVDAHKRKKNVIIQGDSTNILLKNDLPTKIFQFYTEMWNQTMRFLFEERPTHDNTFLDSKNFSIPKDLLLKNKLLFNKELICDEDVDFALQAAKHNIPIYYDSKIKVKHFIKRNWGQLLILMINYGRCRARLEKRWGLRRKKTNFLNEDNLFSEWNFRRKKLLNELEKKSIIKVLNNTDNSYAFFFKISLYLTKILRYSSYMVERMRGVQ